MAATVLQFMRPGNPNRRLVALILACLASHPVFAGAADSAPLFSTDGYRIAEFMAPVPQSAPGAVTVGTAAVRSLVEHGGAVLVDVLPAPTKPQGLPPTALWMPPERRNISGSAWLPNVGYGRLSEELEDYFRGNLERLTGGNLGRKIVIYCLADCWMSWNAARRAVRYGYTAVYWYPEGTTGWEAAGLPLETGVPVPIAQSR
jgi:PQQ-dependent catabolism-associated CXXCW motif protein